MADSAQDTVVVDSKSMGPSSSSFQQKSVEGVAMTHGDGEDSYSKNSTGQKRIIDAAKQELDLGLEQVVLPCEDGGRMVVVDLGCSSGPNTIDIMSHIVDNLKLRMTVDADFQCYFNDTASNDFNNLFRLLSIDGERNRFFVAGVPGSFFGRLFPRTNVNVFYSANSLHWMSKIPDAVLDKNSPAYNGGRIWYKHSRLAVAAAYKEQASLDLKSFLFARESELVPGGLLSCNFFGSSSDLSPVDDRLSDIVADMMSDICEAWTEMISEGLLTQVQLDNFNIPVYVRGIEEINEAIESCGSSFRVLTAKVHVVAMNLDDLFPGLTSQEMSIKLAKIAKSIFSGLLEASLTKHACSILWQRYEKVAERRIIAYRDQGPPNIFTCTITLIKNLRS